MSKESQTDLNEMMAGDGSGLALPPSFVFVNTKKRSVRKRKEEKMDGRKKGARKLVKRILKNRQKRKGKMSEELMEAQSSTERAQKQIAQSKKLDRQKDLQKKRGEAKEKMQNKAKEMDTLLKARLSDFKSKSAEKQKKMQKQNASFEPQGDMIAETSVSPSVQGNDVFSAAFKIAQEGSSYGRDPETSFAMVQFADGNTAQMGYFDAQKIVAAYEGLTPENREKFCALLNMNASTYTNALHFAQYNV